MQNDSKQACPAAKERPRITIVTVVRNNEANVASAIESVLRQTYDNLEYIVLDGKSTDGTWNIIKKYKERADLPRRIDIALSEADDGLYDALNKGIALATGDYIGFVHADDELFDERVLADVASRIAATGCDFLYGDGVYVDAGCKRRVVRRWIGGSYSRRAVRFGWLPLHPTVFISKEAYARHGVYDKSLRIAGDTDLLIRLLYGRDLGVAYLHRYIIRMSMGGMSTSARRSTSKWGEDLAVLRRHGLPSYVLLCKIVRKLPQYFLQRGFYAFFFGKIIQKI